MIDGSVCPFNAAQHDMKPSAHKILGCTVAIWRNDVVLKSEIQRYTDKRGLENFTKKLWDCGKTIMKYLIKKRC
ncbi:MAG: hypothetical protein SVW57_02225 [Thermodesulfobacteriota bacterium]|nr:hypothetical protein [Thermodesulfobacteriota bacterium]